MRVLAADRTRAPGGSAVRSANDRKKKRCTRWVAVKGSFTVAGNAGANSFTFRGRIGGKKLKPGAYRLSAQATDPAKNTSLPKRKKFKIVR